MVDCADWTTYVLDIYLSMSMGDEMDLPIRQRMAELVACFVQNNLSEQPWAHIIMADSLFSGLVTANKLNQL